MTDHKAHAASNLTVKNFKIAEELFTTGFKAGQGPFNCTSRCCHRGAYMDVAEREVLIQHADLLKRHMDSTQTTDIRTWFETEDKVDSDYVSGKCVGTGTHNEKCSFQNEKGWCTVQVAGAQELPHKWSIKPLYCVIFPVEVIENTVQFNPMMQGKEPCCSTETAFDTPLYEACKERI